MGCEASACVERRPAPAHMPPVDMGLDGRSDPAGQQTWEALCMLIALRVWKRFWLDSVSFLTTKTDNMTTLMLITKLKASGRGPAIVARELALDLGDASHSPNMRTHISGISNNTCDALSRLNQPGKSYCIPPSLSHLSPTTIPRRDVAWYKSLDAS